MRICEHFKNRGIFSIATRAALIVYCFSELDEEGFITDLIAFQKINKACGLSKSSYYRGIKELTENGFMAKSEIKDSKIEKVNDS